MSTRSLARHISVAVILCAACKESAPRPKPIPQPGPSVAATDPFADCSYSGSGTLVPHVTFEPSAAIGGPPDARLIVALYYQGYIRRPDMNGGMGFVLATSRDSGATWADYPIPFGACAHNRPGDAVANGRVAVGPDGTTYVVAVAGDDQSPLRLVLTASPDGGDTWTAPDFQSMAGFCHADEPSITADLTTPGRAYAVWVDACFPDHAALGMATTTDGGRTWSKARDVPLAGYKWVNWPIIVSDPASTGKLHLFFSECQNKTSTEYSVVTMSSSDGGTSWSTPVVVASGPGEYGAYPSPALSPDGSLYVAWDTWDKETRIMFSRSQDAGATWSTPKVVAQTWRRASLATNSEGAVAIAFTPDSLIVSNDGGQTFGSPNQFSDLPLPNAFYGDYTIAALADGADFHAIFSCMFGGMTSTCFW